jgi:Putative glycolipid-binding
VPSGRYAVRGRGGDVVGTEDFRCAPGPVGWRYVSEIERDEPTPHRETVDVAVDADWRIVRARIETGSHSILLEPIDAVLGGVRDGERIEVAYGPDWHLDYLTPAMNAITAQRLGATTEIDVVYLQPVTLEPIPTRQRYELVRREVVATAVGKYVATRWHYTALTTGWESDLWVADDVVMRYDRAFELISYEPGATGPVPVPSPPPPSS